MSSTNPGGGAASALHALHALAQTAARTLHALLHGLFRRPRAARPPAAIASRPGAGAPAGDLTGREHTPRSAGVPPPGSQDRTGLPDAELPHAYGQSRMVLLARDPWTLFAHWEISPVRRVEVLRSLGEEGEHAQEILRLYETGRIPHTSRDIMLAPGAGRAQVEVEHPGRTYRVEVGLRTASGRFVPLAASNVASTPAAHPSDDTSVRWVTLGPDGAAGEVAVAWSGRRVTTTDTATALDTSAGALSGRPGSSEALPPGPRASDALPIR